MVELRKRKAAEAPAAPPLTKRPSSVKTGASKGEAAATGNNEAPANGASSGSKVTTGDAIDFGGFGGEVETNKGEKITLKELVEDSKSGVVLFTYPKASTPGCRSALFLFCSYFCAPLYAFGFSCQFSGHLRLIFNRHHSGLPFQRGLQTIDRNWVLYLWTVHRLAKIQHNLQDEA